MMYEECWYWCSITEADDTMEPDWDRIPADRRELVRSRWKPKTVTKSWLLWGPQIPFFQRHYEVQVIN